MEEPTDYPEGAGDSYENIQRNLVDPIERSHGLSLRITTAIANHFGAHG
jgi:phosphoenolpyruvate carboxylase